MVADPDTTAATPLLGAPVNGEPFSVKVTLPIFGVGLAATVAVKLTEAPSTAFGFALDVTVVVVGWPVAGEIVRHHPPAAVALMPGPMLLYIKSFQAPLAAAPENAVWKVELPTGGAYTKLPGTCGAGAGALGVKESGGGPSAVGP